MTGDWYCMTTRRQPVYLIAEVINYKCSTTFYHDRLGFDLEQKKTRQLINIGASSITLRTGIPALMVKGFSIFF